MAKTLPYEHLDVGASENTIQFLLSFSKATSRIPMKEELEGLEEFNKN